MNSTPKRVEFLDSIRGLAALAVLLFHTLFFSWPPAVGRFTGLPIINMAFNGKEAVAMFFVLSGYVLSRPYFNYDSKQPRRKMQLPAFYLRRFTRIWPPWFFALVLSALAQATLFRDWTTTIPLGATASQFWNAPLTIINFLRQCIFAEHNQSIQLVMQDWSLCIELKASVLLPLFILLATSGWRLAGLMALAVGLLVLWHTGNYYVSFIMGVLLARFGGRLVAWVQAKPAVLKPGLLVLGGFCYQAFQIFGAGKFTWTLTSFGCVLMLLACLTSRRIQAILHLPPVVFLGRISYSVYLLQFIVILCVLPPWMHLLNVLGIERVIWLLPLTFAASIGVTVLLSAAAYRWVEAPCIELGHLLSRRFQK
jgi:peptidoglycan/LPS O-acetylase OafA/YrhL